MCTKPRSRGMPVINGRYRVPPQVRRHGHVRLFALLNEKTRYAWGLPERVVSTAMPLVYSVITFDQNRTPFWFPSDTRTIQRVAKRFHRRKAALRPTPA